MKIKYVHCGEETNISDPRSYEHYYISSWNKTWKKYLRDTGAALWSLRWIQINHLSDE